MSFYVRVVFFASALLSAAVNAGDHSFFATEGDPPPPASQPAPAPGQGGPKLFACVKDGGKLPPLHLFMPAEQTSPREAAELQEIKKRAGDGKIALTITDPRGAGAAGFVAPFKLSNPKLVSVYGRSYIEGLRNAYNAHRMLVINGTDFQDLNRQSRVKLLRRIGGNENDVAAWKAAMKVDAKDKAPLTKDALDFMTMVDRWFDKRTNDNEWNDLIDGAREKIMNFDDKVWFQISGKYTQAYARLAATQTGVDKFEETAKFKDWFEDQADTDKAQALESALVDGGAARVTEALSNFYCANRDQAEVIATVDPSLGLPIMELIRSAIPAADQRPLISLTITENGFRSGFLPPQAPGQIPVVDRLP